MGTAAIAVQLLLGLLDRASAIGGLIAKAQTEKRDITSAELDVLVTDDDLARKALNDAIDKAKAGAASKP